MVAEFGWEGFEEFEGWWWWVGWSRVWVVAGFCGFGGGYGVMAAFVPLFG